MKIKLILFILFILLISINIYADSINIGFSYVPVYFNYKIMNEYRYDVYKEDNKIKTISDPYVYDDIAHYCFHSGNFGFNLNCAVLFDKQINSKLDVGFCFLFGYEFSFIAAVYFSNNILTNFGVRFTRGEKKKRTLIETSLLFTVEFPYYPYNDVALISRGSYNDGIDELTGTYSFYPDLNFSAGPVFKVGFVTAHNKFQFEFLGFTGSTFGFSYYDYFNGYDFFSNVIRLGIELRWLYHKELKKKN